MNDRVCCTPPPVLRHHPEISLQEMRNLSSSADSLGGSSASPRRRHSPNMARKMYGSVEELSTINSRSGSLRTKRFRLESQSLDSGSDLADSKAAAYLENPEIETRWYFKYFLGKVHQNFLGWDPRGSPFFLSVVATDADNHGMQYRCILWRKEGNTRLCLPFNPGKSLNYKTVLQQFNMTKFEKTPREISSPAIQKDLLTLEEQEGTVNFKFGVLYCKDGQTVETDMFSNVSSSENYKQFLKLLGEKVPLQDWDRYRGGLDVKSGRTGTHSVFTVFKGHELMFHVSTMLPYSTDNPQQLERKRHIGNDICVIVFCDGKQPSFQPSALKSKFVHIFAIVSFDEAEGAYRLQVYSSEAVPVFGPLLPSNKAFKDHLAFREFLLAKLMNGEKAAYMTPVFKEKRERTMDLLIKNLAQDYEDMMMPRHSSFIAENLANLSPRVQRRKVHAKMTEFLQIGQDLKFKKIVKGDAPTSLETSSLQTSSLFNRDPWEPQPLFEDPFEHVVYCGDTWGEQVVIGSSGGVFILNECEYHLIIDKVMVMQQITVSEHLGFAFMRGSSSKDKYLYIIPLSQLHSFGSGALSKADCKKCRIGKTKGCTSFSVSPLDSKVFHIAVAMKSKVLIYKWVYPGEGLVTPELESHPEEGLQLLKEISLSDPPSVMRLIDGSVARRNDQLCVGYRRQFDLIDLVTFRKERIHELDKKSKESIVSVIDVYEDNYAEVVVTYGHSSLHRSLAFTEEIPDVDIRWNSAPTAIAFVFPYILGFSTNAIEIRLSINGSLVHTLKMPNIQLISDKNDLIFVSSAAVRRTSIASTSDMPSSPKPKSRAQVVSTSGGSHSQARAMATNFMYKISADSLAGISPSSSPASSSPVNPAPPSGFSTLIVGAPMFDISRTKSLKRFRQTSQTQNPYKFKTMEDLELALGAPGKGASLANGTAVDMSPISPSLTERGLPMVSLTSAV
eukprot:m.308911 g.308911  ORF g.308911 m.308911 type:complete len:956 (+) comp45054_c0_seq1:83-2950(+)